MFEPKRIAKFALWAMVIFSLLCVPWKARDRAYAEAFRRAGDRVFARFWFWPQASVNFLDLRSTTLFEAIDDVTPGTLPPQFKPPPPEDVVQDTLMVLQNSDALPSIGMVRTSSRPIGYWPTAALLSLILATPMRCWRKASGLLVGLVLVHGFVAFRLTILLLHTGFADPVKKYRLFTPSPRFGEILTSLDKVFADDPTFAFVAPVFIWLLVVFVVHLVGPRGAQASESAEGSAA